MDIKVCPICWGYHGRIFTDEELTSTFPYYEFGYPNVHPNCRCRVKPYYVDEKSMKKHFNIVDRVWEDLPESAKFVLVSHFLAMLIDDAFKRCVKNEMKKGKTREEAEESCRAREEEYPATGDEVARTKRLLANHKIRYRPLI